MVRRHQRNVFAPGVYAFPGGAVEEADLEFPDELLLTSQGEKDRTVLDSLIEEGLVMKEAKALIVAGLRETFEETGILPDCVIVTGRGEGTQVLDLARMRKELLGGFTSFARFMEAFIAATDLSMIRYLAHWITPEGLPMRYDTRFFLTPFSGRETPECDPGEISSYCWINPKEALERCQRGEFPMLPPTVAVLGTMARYEGLPEAMQDLTGRSVYAVCPRITEKNGKVTLEIPDGSETG